MQFSHGSRTIYQLSIFEPERKLYREIERTKNIEIEYWSLVPILNRALDDGCK